MGVKKGMVPWNKGKHFPEEVRKKMSNSMMGTRNPFFGKRHTEESKKKMSNAHRGHVSWNKGVSQPEETRRKISDSTKGVKHWNYGKRLSEETKAKMSKAHKGRITWIKGKHLTEEQKKHLSEVSKGEHRSEETEYKKGHVSWTTGRHHSNETKKKMSQSRIRIMKSRRYNTTPTVPEKIFIEICTKYNLPYKYVGDGKFWIENVNPDFVESNGNKIAIEIYGDYWHSRLDIIKRDVQRTTVLNRYGWKLYVIWEHELKQLSEEEIVQHVTGVIT